jgi:hypothetical protein
LQLLLRESAMSATTRFQPDTRQPVKTKSELREMLAEAVRNTKPETGRQPKIKDAKQPENKP